METNLRYAMVVQRDGQLERKTFREVKQGDIFRLHEPDGEVIITVDHVEYWFANGDPFLPDITNPTYAHVAPGVHMIDCEPVRFNK